MDSYCTVKDYLGELGYVISAENSEEGTIVVEKETEGIKNLVISVVDPILIMEQFIFEIVHGSGEIYKRLLIKNRDIIHGAFGLDEGGKKVIFRDTLQLENLDMNELEGSLNSLSLLLSEFSEEIIEFSKN